MYEERVYRNLFKGKNLTYFEVKNFETDLKIGADENLYHEALGVSLKLREDLESYIKTQPAFLKTLEPIEPRADAPEFIKRMCKVAIEAKVGPMASVAGVFSEIVGKHLMNFSKEVIIENGGDIFLKTQVNRKIGIYAGKSILSNKIGIEIYPEDSPIAICTSAGKIGHSLSLGNTDAAIVVSKDTFLADCCATKLGNLVKTKNDIDNAIEKISNINGVIGCIVIIDEQIGIKGKLKIIKL